MQIYILHVAIYPYIKKTPEKMKLLKKELRVKCTLGKSTSHRCLLLETIN